MTHLLLKTLYLKVLFRVHQCAQCASLCFLSLPGGNKKDRHGCEVLTLMLQALQSIVTSEALTADRVLVNPQLHLTTLRSLNLRKERIVCFELDKE